MRHNPQHEQTLTAFSCIYVKGAEGQLLTSLNTESFENKQWTALQLCVRVQP